GVERDLEDEILEHIERQTQQNIAVGMSPADAHAAARRAFGNREVVRATARDTWRWVWLEQLALGFRYAVRKLRLAPGFTAVAALSLAIGIGATVTMYAVVDAADIRALPYPNADRLVAMEETGSANALGDSRLEFGAGVSAGTFAAWRTATHAFESMTLVTEPELYWTQDDENERLNLPEVDAQFFSMLGGIPEIGRGVVPRDT